jgi:zinc protease
VRRALLALLLALTLPGLARAATTREVLPNGLRVLVASSPAVDVVTAELLFALPVSSEPVDKQGVRYLTQRLLLRGSTRESGAEMAERLSEVGGNVGVNVGLDYTEVFIQAPTDGFETVMSLLAEVAREPGFAPEEVRLEKERALTAVQSAITDPFQRTYQAFREGIYRDDPYGRWPLGRPATLEGLTRDDVVAFYQGHYAPGVAVLSIAGGVEPDRALRVVRQLFGDWPSAAVPPRPDTAAWAPLKISEIAVRELPGTRTHLILGFPAPAVGDRQYFAMQVVDSLLSGGSAARLPKALRDEAGLAYQVSSFYPTLLRDSHFGIYVVTEPGNVREAKGTVLAELARLRDTPVPAAELVHAKRYLLGTYALGRQQSQAQAYSAAWYEILFRPPGFEQEYQKGIAAVTSAEVQAAARELIRCYVLALTVPSG